MSIGGFFERFKRQRLAYYAWLMWLLMLLLSLAAPLIANDKPLMVYYQSKLYMPIFVDYSETAFGGVFETPTDYQDPVVHDLIAGHGFMVMPVIPYASDTLVLNPSMSYPISPNTHNLLGTDALGRDLLAYTLYALRLSVIFALCLTVAGAMIGILVGGVMGYFAGWADLLGQRLIELWLGLPLLFMLMILSSLFVPSVLMLFMVMLLFSWLPFVAVTRVHFLRTRKANYVLAAKNLGVPNHRIIMRHIMPTCLMLNLAQLPFVLMANIAALGVLDFLGLGLPMGTASLGELLAQGKNHLDTPHIALVGFGVLAWILLLLLFIGEGIKGALSHD